MSLYFSHSASQPVDYPDWCEVIKKPDSCISVAVMRANHKLPCLYGKWGRLRPETWKSDNDPLFWSTDIEKAVMQPVAWATAGLWARSEKCAAELHNLLNMFVHKTAAINRIFNLSYFKVHMTVNHDWAIDWLNKNLLNLWGHFSKCVILYGISPHHLRSPSLSPTKLQIL